MRSRLTGGLALLAALLASGLVVASCGDDDDALTKSEFIKQADAICKQGNERIDAEAKKIFTSGKQPSQAQLNQFATETLIPDVQRQVDDVRALDEPSEDEDQVNAFLDSAQADLDKGEEDPSYLTSEKSFAKTNKLGQQYGFKVCSAD